MSEQFFTNWSTQLRKGILTLCILNDIRNRRMYGYEIVRHMRKIEGLVMSEGIIYPILSRLKQQGFVRTTIGESNEGPMRKYYQLTPKGEEALAQMNAYWQAVRNQTDSIKKDNRYEKND